MNSLEKYFDLIKKRPQEFVKSSSLEIITDKKTIDNYVKNHNVTIGLIYESPFHILVVDLVRDGKGRMFTYERLLKTVPGGTVVLPIHKKKIVLINQFRHSLRNTALSFPRGFQEIGISTELNAGKELNEELGVNNFSLRLLGKIVADSGICGNEVSVYLAVIDDIPIFRETEGINKIIELTEQEFMQKIRDHEITDGYTLGAFSLYKSVK